MHEEVVRVLEDARSYTAMHLFAEDRLFTEGARDVALTLRVVELDAVLKGRISVNTKLPDAELVDSPLLLILREVHHRPSDEELLLLPADLRINDDGEAAC